MRAAHTTPATSVDDPEPRPSHHRGPISRRAWRSVGWVMGVRPGPRHDAALRRAVDGRVVLVTGASEGIGRAFAREVAAAGATTLLVARNQERLEDLAQQIAADGGTAHVHRADLSDGDDIDRLAAEVLDVHGHVDVLVNNAGRSIRRAVTDTVDRFHDVERVTTLNYFGAIRLTLALLPSMVERRSGHVVQVTTLGTIFHVPRFSAYLGAKAALEEYSRVLATEVARDRVHVSLVHLPLVRTAMMGPSEGTFKGTPTISAEQASTLVARAIAHRRPQVSMGLRPLITTVDSFAPRVIRSAWGRMLRR